MNVKTTVDQLNGNAVQPATEKAKNATGNAVTWVAAFIEDVLLPNLGRTQALLLAGLALAQEIMKRNRKNTTKNMSDVQDTVASTAKTSLNKAQNVAQSGLNTAQDVAQSGLSTARSALQSGLSSAQDAAQSGLDTAQDVLQKNAKRANKNLKKAQKRMKIAQKTAAAGSTVALSKAQDMLQSSLESAQDALQSSLSTSQDALQKNVKRASKNLKKAGKSMQDMGDTVQHKTSKFFFRTGIVAGLVLILLFTPWPGSETRAKLANLFQQVKQNITNLTSGS